MSVIRSRRRSRLLRKAVKLLASRLREGGLRVEVDDSRETLGKKIRDAQLQKVPYALVIGDKEIEADVVSVRDRSGTEARCVAIDAFLRRAMEEVESRAVETGAVEDLA